MGATQQYQTSRWKQVIWLLGICMILGMMYGAYAGDFTLTKKAAMLFILVCGIVTLPRSSRLVVKDLGFEEYHRSGMRTENWSDIGSFAICSRPNRQPRVGFIYTDDRLGRLSSAYDVSAARRALGGCDRILLSDYGMSSEKLCTILNNELVTSRNNI